MHKNFLTLRLLSLIFLAFLVRAQKPHDGRCFNLNGVKSFNYTAMNGYWYEYARTPRTAEDGAKCIAFDFQQPVSNKWPVSRLQISDFLGIGTNTTRYVRIQENVETKAWDGYDVTFLDADYDDYVVIYGCQSILFQHKLEILWILTRQRNPSPDTILRALRVIKSNNLSLDEMHATNQDGCPDYNNTFLWNN